MPNEKEPKNSLVEFYGVPITEEDIKNLSLGHEVRKKLLSDPDEPDLFVKLKPKLRKEA